MADQEQQNLLPKSVTGRIGLVMMLAMLAAFAGFLGYRLGGGGDPERAANEGRVPIGGPFTLVDSAGNSVTEKDLLGRYAMIYFGYTYCPDICPTALASAVRGLDLLASVDQTAAQMVVPVFISIDSERDTPDTIGRYVAAFHPRLRGFTGSPEQVAEAAKSYRVFYQKVQPEDSSDYLMDHASNIFLMGPTGEYVTHFAHNSTPDVISEHLEEIITGSPASQQPARQG